MEALLGLMLILGVLQESDTPIWTDEPIKCDQVEIVDMITAVEKAVNRTYLCVEEAEVINLPSYLELLQLPAPDQKPVVAVYDFLDKSGQRKDSASGQSFSTL